MKKLIYITSLIFIFISCKKENVDPEPSITYPPSATESGSVLVDGATIQFHYFGATQSADTLTIVLSKNLDASFTTIDQLETIALRILNPQLATYTFSADTMSFNGEFMAYINDAIGEIDNNYNSAWAFGQSVSLQPELTITEFDLINNRVSGSFQGHLFRRDGSFNLLGETVLTNGSFSVDLD